MRYRPIDHDPDDARLGRFIPDDWEYLTSLRSAAEVLVAAGHAVWKDEYGDDEYTERDDYQADTSQGLSAFRWAESVDDVHLVLANDRAK